MARVQGKGGMRAQEEHDLHQCSIFTLNHALDRVSFKSMPGFIEVADL